MEEKLQSYRMMRGARGALRESLQVDGVAAAGAAETAGAGWGGSARARAGPSYVLMKSVCRTALRSARTVSRRRRVPVMGSGM